MGNFSPYQDLAFTEVKFNIGIPPIYQFFTLEFTPIK